MPCLASELPSGQGPHLPLTWGVRWDARRLKAPPLTPAECVSRGPSSLLREQR